MTNTFEPRPDDTVWLAEGGPGIVVGVDHGHVSLLWPTGRVTRHGCRFIRHCQPFTPSTT